jgi:hypothetical protein
LKKRAGKHVLANALQRAPRRTVRRDSELDIHKAMRSGGWPGRILFLQTEKSSPRITRIKAWVEPSEGYLFRTFLMIDLRFSFTYTSPHEAMLDNSFCVTQLGNRKN